MTTRSLKDAKASFSSLVDQALKGEFVTITRHGKPVAALVSVEAAEIARKALEKRRPGLVAYLRAFPGGEFARKPITVQRRRVLSDFLLDTNVVSLLSPTGTEASATFLDWLQRRDDEGRLFLSVVTLHEIERGVALLEHKGASAKAARLRAWLTGLVAAYADRILGLDAAAAAFSGRLEARAMAARTDPGMADAMLAGVAKAHDLVIVTRNTKDFAAFEVVVRSPDEVAALL